MMKNNQKEKIILIGGGGHCKSVIDVIESENRFDIVGIVDKKDNVGQTIFNYAVIGCDEDLEVLFKEYKYAFITIGQISSAETRVVLYKRLKEIGFELPVIISSRAYVSKHTHIEDGTVIMHDALINAGAKIGRNCIINSKALIEHDCVIKENCHVSTGAVVNGGVIIEEKSFIGSNSVTKQYITIAKESFIKAGSLVR
jgi:sugar O-acyltransferase (sialic acid O-acetyltransferase NeuD family)